MTTDTASPFAPGTAIDRDPLPPDAIENDRRRGVHVALLVTRVLDGNRAVVAQTPDCYRGSAVLPAGWIRPYEKYPKAERVYRFSIPIFKWSEKRRSLLGLMLRRRAEGVSTQFPRLADYDNDNGPAPAA
jgi:hypothetical protein